MKKVLKSNLLTLLALLMLSGCNYYKCPSCADTTPQHEFIKIENNNDIYIPYEIFCFKQNIILDNDNNKIEINLKYFDNSSPYAFSFEEIIREWFDGFLYSKELKINEKNLNKGDINQDNKTISLELNFSEWDDGGYIMIDFSYYVWYYDLNDRIYNI